MTNKKKIVEINKSCWDKISLKYHSSTNISTIDVHYGPLCPGESDLKLLGDVKGKRILVLGCGAGHNSVILAKMGGYVTAIDISKEQLSLASNLNKEHNGDIQFILGDISNLGLFKDESFDIVFSSYTLHFIPRFKTIARDVFRVLSDDGTLVFSAKHPLSYHEKDRGAVALRIKDYYTVDGTGSWDFGGGEKIPFRLFYITTEEIIDILVNNGLNVEKILAPRPIKNHVGGDNNKKAPYRSEYYSCKIDYMGKIPHTIIIKAKKSRKQGNSTDHFHSDILFKKEENGLDNYAKSLSIWDKKHLWHPRSKPGVAYPIIVKGKGCFVWDINGNRYLDANAGLRNVISGHGREEIIAAVKRQLLDVAYYPLDKFSHVPAIELAHRLSNMARNKMSKVFFSPGGTEAIETAIKIARQYHYIKSEKERKKILFFDKGYHGCTYGSLSANISTTDLQYYGPFLDAFLEAPTPNCGQDCKHWNEGTCEYECLDKFREIIRKAGSNKIAALLTEPVFASADFIFPREQFFKRVKEICKENDILIIVDEISTSLGRTGLLWGMDHWGIVPDILVTSKGLTSGHFPIAATIVDDTIANAFITSEDGFLNHAFTGAGHPAACAAALANLNILERERLIDNSREMGEHILKELRDNLDSPFVKDIRGKGLMIIIELQEAREKVPGVELDIGLIGRLFRENGIICKTRNIIGFFPPLTLDRPSANFLVNQTIKVFNDAKLSYKR